MLKKLFHFTSFYKLILNNWEASWHWGVLLGLLFSLSIYLVIWYYTGNTELLYSAYGFVYVFIISFGCVTYLWDGFTYSNNRIFRIIQRFSLLHIYLIIFLCILGILAYLLDKIVECSELDVDVLDKIDVKSMSPAGEMDIYSYVQYRVEKWFVHSDSLVGLDIGDVSPLENLIKYLLQLDIVILLIILYLCSLIIQRILFTNKSFKNITLNIINKIAPKFMRRYLTLTVDNIVYIHTHFMKYIIIFNITLLFLCLIGSIFITAELVAHFDEYIQVYNEYYSINKSIIPMLLIKNSSQSLHNLQTSSGLH